MKLQHTTRQRAERELSANGFEWVRGALMGGGFYRNEAGNRALIDEINVSRAYRPFRIRCWKW